MTGGITKIITVVKLVGNLERTSEQSLKILLEKCLEELHSWMKYWRNF